MGEDSKSEANVKTPATEPKAASSSPAPGTTNGLAIAAMVVGIVAFLSGLVPFWGFIAGAVAIVLAALALKKPNGKGMAIAGLVTGAVGALSSLIFSVLFIMAFVVGTASIGSLNEVAQNATETLNEYNADNQAKIDAKKDFASGETATFDSFEVKVNSVEDGYTPEDSYSAASDGKEYIVVTMTIKNVTDEPVSISPYTFKILDNGVAQSASYLEPENELQSGELAAGASTTGSVIYEVTTGADDLKLQYSTYAYDSTSYESKTLVYTLAL